MLLPGEELHYLLSENIANQYYHLLYVRSLSNNFKLFTERKSYFKYLLKNVNEKFTIGFKI